MLIAGLLLAGGHSAAQAEEDDPAAPLPTPYEEVVVVTATRSETRPPRVGSSVTVLAAEEMTRRQYRFVVDALRDVVGVDIRRSGGPGSQTSIFTRGADSDQTLLLIDGVQVQDPSSPNSTPALDNLLVDDIERVEIVRGPQSTLYGSDAIGGVINIITRRGAGKPNYSAAVEAGSFGTTNAQFRTSGGTDRTNYSFSATRFDTDGFSARTDNPEDDPYENTSLAARFGVETGETFGFDLIARFIDSDLGIDAGLDPVLSFTDSEQTILKLEPHWTMSDGRWDQKLSMWRSEITRENSGSGFVLPSAAEGSILGFDWQNNLPLPKGHDMTAGAEFKRLEGENRIIGVSGFAADYDNLAIYFQDYYEWRDRFSATAGVRYDDNSEFGDQVTWRLTGSYTLAGSPTRFHGSVGTGFKAPSLAELFDASFGSNNPDLQPEESFGADAGITRAWGRDGRYTAGATLFYNDIDNLIVAVFNGSVFQNLNVERVETGGAETFLEFLPGPRWISRVTYTYTRTEAIEAASFGLTQGEPLLRRPENEASGSLTYLFPGDRGQSTVSLLYVGDRLDLEPVTFATVTADDYLVVNLAGSWRLNRTLELFGRVDNLFDEEYQEVLGFNAAGLSAYAGVRVVF
jgi:vitamin B12 transporter